MHTYTHTCRHSSHTHTHTHIHTRASSPNREAFLNSSCRSVKKWPLPARQEAFDAEVREGLGRGVQGDDVTGDVRGEGGGMGREGGLERGAGVDVGVGSGA